MNVGRFRVQRAGVKIRDAVEVAVFAGRSNSDVAETLCFFARQTGKVTGFQVSRFVRWLQAQQVQWHSSKLHLRTAVDVKNFKVIRQTCHFTQQFVGLSDQGIKLFAAVADFDHGTAHAVPVQKIFLCLFHDRGRQHGRTRTKIVYAIHLVSSQKAFKKLVKKSSCEVKAR